MKVTDTTIFRMALKFALVFELITVGALITVYYTTLIEFQEQIDSELLLELDDIVNDYQTAGIGKAAEIVSIRQKFGENLKHFYALAGPTMIPISGSHQLINSIQPKNIDNTATVSFFNIGNAGISESMENLLRVAVKKLPGDYTIIVAQSQLSLIELREHVFTTLLITVVVTLFLVILSGIYMGKIVLSRILLIDTGLDNAISSNFTQKLPLPQKNDEFRALTSKLNITLERVEKLILGMRQVSDNIAHDLLSPITRLRSRLEVTLLNPRRESEYREVMAQVLDDTEELIATFNALLSIAQAEARVQREKWGNVDLSLLLEEMSELYQVLAEEKEQNFECIISARITIQANRQLLAQAVSNLLENAIKYCDKQARITLTLSEQDNSPLISVADNGPGIPAQDRERVLHGFSEWILHALARAAV